jgi:putative DNA primase/helicase
MTCTGFRGLAAVRDSIAAAKAPADGVLDMCGVAKARAREWPEPEPLTEPLDAQPYPDEALPHILRDAVRQAQEFVQAPMALVACSALSALSLAAQGLANVRRDHQLVGPISLYLLAVADSGERKTTCDAIFCPALRDWEIGRRQEMSPEIAKLEAATAVFEAKKAGILDAIKHKRRRAQDTAGEESELDALMGDAPVPPLVPRLLYADATPEALAHALATGWPSGGVLSAEAGAVFGAHGMGQDTILRNLALLNVLWDGGEMAIDRRSKPSFVLRGRRLTFGLMVQPEALRGFLERAGTLPRGTGFIARFLIAWPGSTQGTRAYRPAPEAMPQVALFRRASWNCSRNRSPQTRTAASPRRCWICRRRHVPSGYAFTMRSRANWAREAHSAACAMLRPRRRRTSRGWQPCSMCWSMARAAR